MFFVIFIYLFYEIWKLIVYILYRTIMYIINNLLHFINLFFEPDFYMYNLFLILDQTDTRQKTKNQNDSPSPPWISTGMNEEEYTLDTTFGECPSSTKKARLFLHQSGNDSSEIRTITYDDYDVRNVSSTNKQSKKKKILKVKSIL